MGGGGKGIGKSMHHLYSTDRGRLRFPAVRTIHPQGRAPDSVWIVRRGSQIILLIHAADGRVALAQISGPGDSIPPLSHPGSVARRPWDRPTKAGRWDVWCRRFNDPFDGTHMQRLTLRRRFAVPVCDQILAVLPRDDEIDIVHKLFSNESPRLWRAPVSEDGSLENGFVPLLGHGKGGGRGKNGLNLTGMRAKGGAWAANQWHSSASQTLPENVVTANEPGVCEVLLDGAEQPTCEFQRWQVLHPDAKPIVLHPSDESLVLPRIGPGRGGGKGKGNYVCSGRFWTTAPQAYQLQESTGAWTSVRWEPSVSQWTTSAKIA